MAHDNCFMHRRILLLSLWWVGLALWLIEPQRLEATEVVILRVLDGDTLEAKQRDGTVMKLRLDGIDCPEQAQPHGMEARKRLAQLVEGGRVDVTIRRRDRYGRAVARIQAPNGKDINEQLVREGQCWWYRQYAPRDERLAHAEAWARAERRGVWTDPNPTPPWIWRKQHQR